MNMNLKQITVTSNFKAILVKSTININFVMMYKVLLK